MSPTRSSRHFLRTRRLPSGGVTLLCAGQGVQLPVVSAGGRLPSSGLFLVINMQGCIAELHVLF